MEFKDALDLPYEGPLNYQDVTLGWVLEELQKRLTSCQRKSQDLQSALRLAEGERDRGLEREEELKKQIDSVKVLDLLTRSSLTSKLQITEDSELGKVLTGALADSLRGVLGGQQPSA